VSFYSVSSPQEWFAESYAQYYRTEKRGTGLDSATITQMASLDSMHWDPARGALAPSSPSNTGNAGDSSTASGAGKVPAPTAGTGAGTAATPPPAPGADVLPLGLKPVSLKI
jgi:hypothetical protein